MSSYLNEALAYERMQRYQAEAADYRRMKATRSDEPGRHGADDSGRSSGSHLDRRVVQGRSPAAHTRSLTSGEAVGP